MALVYWASAFECAKKVAAIHRQAWASATCAAVTVTAGVDWTFMHPTAEPGLPVQRHAEAAHQACLGLQVSAPLQLTLWPGDVQDAGMRAISDLDKSLDEFMELMEKKDKQDIPIKQQEALGYVGIIEEAMVRGFPYEVPKQYANLPQLKVRLPRQPGHSNCLC